MAGIIEKMSASTDLIGIDVAATSTSDKGFEACLATEAALVKAQTMHLHSPEEQCQKIDKRRPILLPNCQNLSRRCRCRNVPSRR